MERDAGKLSPVAVIRLSSEYCGEIPSFIDFPLDLRDMVMGHCACIDGGIQRKWRVRVRS